MHATMLPEAAERLDRLTRLCRELSSEYLLAAMHMHEPDVKAVLDAAVDEHAAHARELEELMPASSLLNFARENASDDGRSFDWSELSDAILRGDEHAVLESCLRGERQLLAAYTEAATDRNLSADAAEVVREQLEAVAARHSLIRTCCERDVAAPR
jgi:uncharacterized protein (TIGR02284 family)